VDPTTETPKGSSSRRGARWLGFAIGLVLLAGAGIALRSAGDDFTKAADALGDAAIWQWFALPGLMALSLLATSAVFWIFTKRYGDVGYTEMNGLIGIAWVMNYLPMHPGMFGRLAYHKRVNGVRIIDSTRVLIWANLQTGAAAVIVPAIAYACAVWLGTSELITSLALQLPIALSLIMALVMRTKSSNAHAWRGPACFAIRAFEIQLWAAR